MGKRIWGTAALWILTAIPAHAEVLTASRAVEIALRRSPDVIEAEAALLDARSGLFSAYSGILPRVSADLTRRGQWIRNQKGNQAFGGTVFPFAFDREEDYSTVPQVTASWSVLDLSSWTGFRASRNGVKAAKLSRQAARNDVAFAVRQQFYNVVTAVRLADVATGALRLARDDERRVRALFEVGSVSKSDLLKAQVRTAQGELDSLTAGQAITNQRIVLAERIGVREPELGDVDTVLTAQVRDFDESQLVTEASRQRPDLQAAEASLKFAKSSVTSARLSRIPSVSVGGSAQFNTVNSQSFREDGDTEFQSTRSETDRILGAQVALNWNVFDGLATEARVASARARTLRAQERRDALRRNLESEVHQAVLALREAVARSEVASRALASATENLKLTQEKYNVGSATILDLIDAQVQLQRAQSDGVSALAAIRVAEAQLDRVRGQGQ